MSGPQWDGGPGSPDPEDRPASESRDRPRGVLEHLFEWTLHLYPPRFRREHLPDASAAFRDAYRTTADMDGKLAAGRSGRWHLFKALAAIPSAWYQRYRDPTHEPRDERRPMTPIGFHFRQALKSLGRSPGYALAFVVTFGLAVGVNSAVFSVVNGVLLQPLPFEGGDRILYLKQPARAAGVENTLFSFMELDDYRAGASTIDEFVEFGEWEFTVLDEGEPHRALGGLVTSNYFGVLGMRPAHGRLLNEQDDIRGAEPVALLTDAYWDRSFGRDPSVVGTVIDLEDAVGGGFVPTRIVGVLEPGHHYTGSRQPDLYVNYAVNSHYQDAAMRDARAHA